MSEYFRIHGLVVEKETNKPLVDVFVEAYDKDFIFDDLLGSAKTDKEGCFDIFYSEKDFSDLFEKNPDVYFHVYNKQGGKILYSTKDQVKRNANRVEYFKISVPESQIE